MPVVRAYPLPDADGSAGPAGGRRGTQTWVAYGVPADTFADVLASPLLPQPGDPLRPLRRLPDGAYEPAPAGPPPPPPPPGWPPAPAAPAVADRDCRRDPDHPARWVVSVRYEAAGPLGDPAEVDFGETPYQVQVTADVHGKAVTTSALEPYQDGMTVDRHRLTVTIARTCAYTRIVAADYARLRNTLNQSAWTLGSLTVAVPPPPVPPGEQQPPPAPPAPQVVPPGEAKLTSLT